MYLLNIRLGEILNNKPKKYKTNYADEIIKTALSALSHLQLADSIYLTKYLTKEEFLIRHNALILARGETQHIATACYIFLEIVRKHDYANDIKKILAEKYNVSEKNVIKSQYSFTVIFDGDTVEETNIIKQNISK